MATPKVYVLCDQNCKYEGLTKEQIYTLIEQAVNEGTIGDCDTGFITTIKTINNVPLRFFYGTQSAYDSLSNEQKTGTYAIITNDTFREGVNAAIEELKEADKNLETRIAAEAMNLRTKLNNHIARVPQVLSLTQNTTAIKIGDSVQIGALPKSVNLIDSVSFLIKYGTLDFAFHGAKTNEAERLSGRDFVKFYCNVFCQRFFGTAEVTIYDIDGVAYLYLDAFNGGWGILSTDDGSWTIKDYDGPFGDNYILKNVYLNFRYN